MERKGVLTEVCPCYFSVSIILIRLITAQPVRMRLEIHSIAVRRVWFGGSFVVVPAVIPANQDWQEWSV